ncbi:uncharacterized protein TNCV_4733781 [Trichonephila clavipes]|nr:uncharacterized protein TNCV_4733781 [Trichonephila clavipes]
MEDSMDAGNAKYFRTPMSIKELVLRAGQRKISEINMFLENKQKPSSIPKINPQLLYMEIKSKIPKFDQISNMSFTRNGKLCFATSDPVCAIQILSLDQLFNISVNASVIWEGITSRFLLYEIPTNVSLEELSAESQDSNNFEIVEIRRFIKSGTNPEISPVLITILGTVLPDNVKLWFINHKIQLFIDKPRQCTKCFSFSHPSRFCQSPAICSEKQIMELKCRQHVTLSEARRRFRASNSENLSTVLKSKSQENNIQELIDKKFEKMMTAFQTVVEKQTAFLMEILQKSMETMLSTEALAICQALDDLSIINKNLLILSDSLSVLSALQNYSIKSHSVIHKLASKIYILSLYNNQLILLWTPGHSNILWNEQADNLARTVTESNVYIDWISSEDINKKIYQESFKKANDNFYSSKYFVNLGNIPNISTISKWTRNRREEILCTRIFSKMIITPGLLHKFNLLDNANCRSCNCLNDLDHILLNCNRYIHPRNNLKHFLKIDPHHNLTFKELLEKAMSNILTFRFFIQKLKYFDIY